MLKILSLLSKREYGFSRVGVENSSACLRKLPPQLCCSSLFSKRDSYNGGGGIGICSTCLRELLRSKEFSLLGKREYGFSRVGVENYSNVFA